MADMRRTSLASCGFALLLTGCTGKVATIDHGIPDAPSGGGADAPVAAAGFTVSGKVMDYFALTATPVAAAAITTDGLTPAMSATAGTDGAYALDGVPTGSKLYLSAAATNYRPTRNPTTAVADAAVTQDVYAMATQDVKNKYTALGKTPVAGTGFVTLELYKNNGTPLVGLAPTAIVLEDAAGAPVAGVTPYFYDTNGNPSTAEATSAAYGTPAKARAALIDLPPGSYAIAVTSTNGQGAPVVEKVPIVVLADGAVLAKTGATGGGGAGTGGGTTIADPSFAADIYPRLQRAGAGGLGCANCHTTGGLGAVLILDGGAADALAKITAATGVLDLTTPANSLLLTKPLYEPTPPQNHPNATFLDVNDPDYKLLLTWITKGAKP